MQKALTKYACGRELNRFKTIRTPYRDMLPHHCITNNDVTLLNVLISI